MSVIAYDPYFDEAFAAEHGVKRCASMDEVLLEANVVSLHCFLDENTRGMINKEKIAEMKDGVIVLNCARGELVETDDIRDALVSGKVGATAPTSSTRNRPAPAILSSPPRTASSPATSPRAPTKAWSARQCGRPTTSSTT